VRPLDNGVGVLEFARSLIDSTFQLLVGRAKHVFDFFRIAGNTAHQNRDETKNYDP
jgi:hypothetical protein